MSTLSVTATKRVQEIAAKLNAAGVPPQFSPDQSRLLVSIWKEIAKGDPVEADRVGELIAQAGGDPQELDEFLRGVSERDDQDRVLGAVGLTQKEYPHRFVADGVALTTWCAWDSLFIPTGLQRQATVHSVSPTSGTPIRVEVTPNGVASVSPAEAVVSIAVLDKPVSSVEEAWMVFCHQVLYFASRDEADAWAEGRESIEILTVHEAFELGREAFKAVFTNL